MQINLAALADFHKNMAKDIWPNGLILQCWICDNQIQATVDDCAQYFACGWPRCCGHEMWKQEPQEVL